MGQLTAIFLSAAMAVSIQNEVGTIENTSQVGQGQIKEVLTSVIKNSPLTETNQFDVVKPDDVTSNEVPSESRFGYLFSQKTFITEAKGLTHWIVINDGVSIYSWSIVRNKLQTLIQDAAGVVAMAVDPYKGYLFIADDQTVRRFEFEVSRGDDYMTPTLTLGSQSAVVFRDEGIKSITVDEDHSVLYVASSAGISIIEYAPEVLQQEDVVYGSKWLLSGTNAWSLVTNKKGDLFFTDGVLRRQAADVPNSSSQVESDFFSKVENLHYQDNGVFFVGTSSEGVKGVYMKPAKHGMQTSNLIVQVNDDLDSPTSIGTFDTFIYASDSKGLWAVQTYPNGTFSEKRLVQIGVGIVPKSILTFALMASQLALESALILAAVVALL